MVAAALPTARGAAALPTARTTKEISSSKQNAKKYRCFACLKWPMQTVCQCLRESYIVAVAQVFKQVKKMSRIVKCHREF